MGWWTPQRQAFAVDYLVDNAGLTAIGAAGLVSRWANVESTGAGPASINRSSGAFGIAQWLGSRKAGIYPNADFQSQLEYAVSELAGSENRAGARLRTAQTADQAAVGASMYERAEGYNAQTGRDNFTGRTASGVEQTLAYYHSSGGPSQGPVTADSQQSGYVTAGLSAGAAVGIIAAIGIAWWWFSD
jgi:hypothetical protein